MNTNALSLFFQQGLLIEVPLHQRFFLHDTHHLLYIEKGEADLFVFDIQEESQQNIEPFTSQTLSFPAALFNGSLYFFANVKEGECLFPFPRPTDHPNFVLVIPQKSLTLRQLSIRDIQAGAQSSIEIKEGLDQQLDRWFFQLSFLFASYPLEYPDEQVAPGSSLSIDPNHTVIPISWTIKDRQSHFMWMQLSEGSLLFFNIEGLTLSQDSFLFPLFKRTWFKTLSFSKIQLFENLPIPYEEACWKGLEQFQNLFLKFFTFHQSQLLIKDIAKTRLKIERDRTNFSGALNELQTVLSQEEYSFRQEHRDLLYNTCQLVAQPLHLNFEPLAFSIANLSLEEQIYYLCFYSRIYYREVSLIENWWKYDLGPLLGFYGDDERPVALIPQNGQYQLIDLKDQKSIRMNAQEDQQLSARAFKFYRQLPSKDTITAFELFKFSTYGNLKSLGIVILLGGLSGLFNLFYPFMNGIVFDLIIPNTDQTLLWQVMIGLILVSFGNSIFLLGREYTLVRLEGLIEQDVEAALWQRIFNLKLQFFRRFELGDLLYRILAIKTIRQEVSGRVLRVILNSFFSIIYLFPMFYYSFALALVGTSVVLLGVILSSWAIIKNIQLLQPYMELKGKANNLVLQFLSAISKIRVAGSEYFSFVSWEKIFFRAKKLGWKVEKIETLTQVLNFAISSLSILAIYTAAIFLMKGHSLQDFTIGHFIAFLAAFGPFSYSISNLNLTLLELSHLFPMWKRSTVLFSEPLEVNALKLNPHALSGEIRVDQLSFRYDKNGPLILGDFSLYAKPGEMIGIVGPSGCGKSSLVKLLIGIEHPESGAIYYDGKDLTTLDIKLVRKQIGIVLQTSTILDGTIRDNIIMEGFYTDKEVEKALTLSGFEDDLKHLPMGVHTVLMGGGNTLSGGQKQRLLIARALISKPRLLIMDEATSALDNRTQNLVSQNLDRLQVTRIVIAHRLSTIQHADRIYVIDQGRVVDSGSFIELAERPGLFAEFLKKQQVR